MVKQEVKTPMEYFLGSQSGKEFMRVSLNKAGPFTEKQVEKAVRSYIHGIKNDRSFRDWFYSSKAENLGEPLYSREEIEMIKVNLADEIKKELKQDKLLK